MSAEPTLAESDNPKLLIITGALLVVLVVIVAICVGVDQFYKFAIRDEISSKVLEPTNPQLRALRAKEKHNLHSYQYVNKEKGTVRIPVDVAAQLVLSDWDKRPTGTTPVESGAAPAPAPSPAPEAPAPQH